MNGPTPGIASEPMPASQPSAPPSNPPVLAPTAVPSGALVASVWAKSRVVVVSGKSAEMSSREKPAACKSATMDSAWLRVFATQKTDFAIINSFVFSQAVSRRRTTWLVVINFELAMDAGDAGNALGLRLDRALFRGAVDRSSQRDHTADGDDLHVVSVHRQR